MRTPLSTGRNSHAIFMYWNGPVSIRRARTVRAFVSVVRSKTQFHTLPFSSGCMVSRKRTVSPCRSSTSTLEYSLNKVAQDSTSLAMSHASCSGAWISTELSVCAAISGHRQLAVDEVEDVTRCLHFRDGLIRDRELKFLLYPCGYFKYGQRVEVQLGKLLVQEIPGKLGGVTG